MRVFRFAIDRGGTFTDVYAEMDVLDTQGNIVDVIPKVIKLLSEDPANYPDAPREGIRRVLESMTGVPHPRDQPVDTSRIQSIRMGTTVATNALLERNGERTVLVTTSGFRDMLYIGNQSRSKIFDLEINMPDTLYDSVIEVDERLQLINNEKDRLPTDEKGVSGDYIRVLKKLDVEDVTRKLQNARNDGIESVAIVLLHSYTFPRHEKTIHEIASRLGYSQISLSSEVMPMIKAVPRGFTTCADAYLTPVIKKYVASFCDGFGEGLEKVNISFMQSDGGLARMKHFYGHRAILSGPAGGVVGYARTTRPPEASNKASAVIGFDMGGTSTDVSRFDGKFEHVLESVTANVTVRAPQLDIQTVAAGGGSRLFYKNGLFLVGPESVRAHPGPVCYRKNGYLSVTDANLVTGRILPEFFPKIFGPKEDEPLDVAGSKKAFEELTKEINASAGANGAQYSMEDVASGFLRVANEAMCRPIRNLTQNKGYDISTHILACFGGAGPQHACSIAKALGMSKVYIHRYSGILSAYGLSVADSVVDKQLPASAVYSADTKLAIVDNLVKLAEEAVNELIADDIRLTDVQVQYFLNLRYEGTDNAVMTRGPVGAKGESPIKSAAALCEYAFDESFIEKYQREFGFVLQNRAILIDDVRVRATVSPYLKDPALHADSNASGAVEPCSPHSTSLFYFEAKKTWEPIPVYLHEHLMATRGAKYSGPAIIMQGTATVVIEPEWEVQVMPSGDLYLVLSAKGEEASKDDAVLRSEDVPLDPIQLSVFSHRFMGIAEQMGRTLARTSVSVNIKERLDFSCALFGPDGGLVANAPHLPVHLGAMQQAVRHQLKFWGNDLHNGDVLVSNHPQLAGGSHLPDITVMTPVFDNLSGKIEFFVASRGHHADIGGISPGSMPPLSKTLSEEGAAIVAFKLVDGKVGEFRESEITDILLQKGRMDDRGQPCIGTRNLRDNLSDLRAQVAANQRGVVLMRELCSEYSLPVVTAYMNYIQQAAEMAVRNMLHEFSLQRQLPEVGVVRAEDFMDDGTKIALQITIDRCTKSATFNFEGTGPEVFGNVNTPPAVTYSAIIYCLRCLLPGEDLPLNQGCLTPIDVRFPKEGSILNPSDNAAVVGGNVLTSQRITDVILKAFGACAASQGCMNNLTFGSATLGGYYETIAGGAGAGPSWHGRSGVHTHMTNTRITDPEILEKRYPVLLRAFHLREGSGGTGKYRGGDGVVRQIEFLESMTVSILSERRAFQPYGLEGGGPGARGINLLQRCGGRIVNLGGKNTVDVQPGEILTLYTPGGGGFGAVN
ncbi:5-oxoprolinase [Plasmopara halstedii]|uniref:5-oxoprolinase n=1 Tax=Plasmopara halstedii TaxID=4781 RepID=A0A0P1A9U9_PLAHL|nr:5-oxoprolinase [Plasmopara halstedii]CEG37397.1 5-oxoprolinase [Plasmopara halstedii]|eukprot:XP_024573766.1 5-oxoprolinase [Plasmopara halstedii]